MYSLAANDERKKLIVREFSISAEDIKMGNPYNSSATIEVVSSSFTGKSNIMFDIKCLRAFANKLIEMYEKTKGSAILKDVSDRSYIEMEISKRGNLIVSGLLYDDITEQSLKFVFDTDQTAIGNINILNEFVSLY